MQLAQRTANAIARKENVRVIFRGTEAYTDGRDVVLPAVMPMAWLSQLQCSVMTGYLDHELGHVRFTDFTVGEGVIWDSKKKRVLDPLWKHIWNIVEDVREERCFIERYPGSKVDLDALCDELDGRVTQHGKEKIEVEEGELYDLLASIYDAAWFHRGRPPIQAKALSSFKKGKEMKAAMDLLPKATNTADALAIAKKIKDLIEQEYKKELGKIKKIASEMNVEDLKVIIANGIALPFAQADGDEVKAIAAIPSPGQGNKDDKQDNPKNLPGKVVLPPLTTEQDQVFYYPAGNMSAYRQTATSMRSEMARLSRSLSIFLQSRRWEKWERGKEEGELDNLAVWSIGMGNRRIYKEKRSSRMINTALMYLIDLSGSMDENLVREASILLSESCMMLPSLSLQIMGFDSLIRWGNPNEDSVPGYGRIDAMRLPIFKKFDETAHACRARLGAIKTDGGTPLGDAYGWALEALLMRPEPKKVLIVATDGDPYIRLADRNHCEYLSMDRTHRLARKYGVKTISMNIGRDSMTKYTDYGIQIKDQQGLTPAVLQFTRDLVGGKL